MMLILLLALPYIFSGTICTVVLLKDLERNATLPGWQFLALLASFTVVLFWPVWIILEVKKPTSIEEQTLVYVASNPD